MKNRKRYSLTGCALATVLLARWEGSFEATPAVAVEPQRIPMHVAESAGR